MATTSEDSDDCELVEEVPSLSPRNGGDDDDEVVEVGLMFPPDHSLPRVPDPCLPSPEKGARLFEFLCLDVVKHIFRFLTPSELFRLGFVNRKFRTLSTDDNVWDMHVAGLPAVLRARILARCTGSIGPYRKERQPGRLVVPSVFRRFHQYGPKVIVEGIPGPLPMSHPEVEILPDSDFELSLEQTGMESLRMHWAIQFYAGERAKDYFVYHMSYWNSEAKNIPDYDSSFNPPCCVPYHYCIVWALPLLAFLLIPIAVGLLIGRTSIGLAHAGKSTSFYVLSYVAAGFSLGAFVAVFVPALLAVLLDFSCWGCWNSRILRRAEDFLSVMPRAVRQMKFCSGIGGYYRCVARAGLRRRLHWRRFMEPFTIIWTTIAAVPAILLASCLVDVVGAIYSLVILLGLGGLVFSLLILLCVGVLTCCRPHVMDRYALRGRYGCGVAFLVAPMWVGGVVAMVMVVLSEEFSTSIPRMTIAIIGFVAAFLCLIVIIGSIYLCCLGSFSDSTICEADGNFGLKFIRQGVIGMAGMMICFLIAGGVCLVGSTGWTGLVGLILLLPALCVGCLAFLWIHFCLQCKFGDGSASSTSGAEHYPW